MTYIAPPLQPSLSLQWASGFWWEFRCILRWHLKRLLLFKISSSYRSKDWASPINVRYWIHWIYRPQFRSFSHVKWKLRRFELTWTPALRRHKLVQLPAPRPRDPKAAVGENEGSWHDETDHRGRGVQVLRGRPVCGSVQVNFKLGRVWRSWF